MTSCNVQVLEYRVNAAKGTMTVEEFVAMCRDVARHADDLAAAAASASVPPPPGG